jgi:hypothetical protein
VLGGTDTAHKAGSERQPSAGGRLRIDGARD